MVLFEIYLFVLPFFNLACCACSMATAAFFNFVICLLSLSSKSSESSNSASYRFLGIMVSAGNKPESTKNMSYTLTK